MKPVMIEIKGFTIGDGNYAKDLANAISEQNIETFKGISDYVDYWIWNEIFNFRYTMCGDDYVLNNVLKLAPDTVGTKIIIHKDKLVKLSRRHEMRNK